MPLIIHRYTNKPEEGYEKLKESTDKDHIFYKALNTHTAYKVGSPWGPWLVTRPMLDTLTILVDLKGFEEYQHLWSAFVDVTKTKEHPAFSAVYRKKYAFFWTSEPIHEGSEPPQVYQELQTQTHKDTKEKTYRLRLHFSPERTGKYKFQEFIEDLSYVWAEPDLADRILKKGRVSRYDIAIDILGITPPELVFDPTIDGKRIFYSPKEGELETAYFGKKKKTAPVKVYNKVLQQIEAEEKKKYVANPYTRVEYSRKSGVVLPKLISRDSPLPLLSVYKAPPRPDKVDPAVWKLFLPCVRYLGLESALGLLDEPLQPLVRDAMAEAKAATRRPDKIWKFWPKTLQKYGFYFPEGEEP